MRYHRNLESSPEACERERSNVDAVFAAMDELMRTPTLVDGAVMPDACPTGPTSIPVGGVVVAEDAIHPGFHSSDICCAVMATDLGGDIDPTTVLDAARSVTHFGAGGRKRSAGLFKHLTKDLIDRIRANSLFSDGDLKKAQLHLATQGDGNHFLFVGRSESHGGVMLVTHHGSRAFGASLYETGGRIAEELCSELSPDTPAENAWIPASSKQGKAYWDALQIIRDWTKLNHSLIHRLTAKALGLIQSCDDLAAERTFWNEHNFVFLEQGSASGGKGRYVHAKGATPLDDKFLPDSTDGLRLVPLNMAGPILVVRGKTTESNLGFAPHGAGRNMSRTEHKRKRLASGVSPEQIFAEETEGLDVRFFSDAIDISELPSAYKNAEEVQRQISRFGLGTVVDRIATYGCIMAGHKSPAERRRNKCSSQVAGGG